MIRRALDRANGVDTWEDDGMWTFLPYPDWVIGDLVDVLEATDFHYTPSQILEDFDLFCAVGLEMRLRRMARDEVEQARGKHGR